ncbi:thiolase C-terminal domain-containing protein, partial [Salmonella sp. s51228]|uniref:thiolase C-terminal domain-containing protein n=1 Tax=Salmonella sp. s51228 TaxID=3159652 RepID=UPI0039800311
MNPSGGLISKGHPLGATGLAQCSELCWQLRGQAGSRQVNGARIALQHNLGLGGAVVITLYRHGFPELCYGSKRPYALSHQSTNGRKFKSDEIFGMISAGLKAQGAEMVKKINGIDAFVLPGSKPSDIKHWIVDLKNGNGEVKEGKGKADCT